MDFRTEYCVKQQEAVLSPEKPVLLLGSCFSDNIGQRMRQALWDARVNPCGTLFNPVSIANIIMSALGLRPATCFFEKNGIWISWDFPSSVSGLGHAEATAVAAESLKHLENDFADSQAVIVTFGSSIVYERKDVPDRIVANCHKFPSGEFSRRRLEVEEIAGLWNDVIASLRRVNSGLKFIFTVSPVRHVKEGFVENSLSKATLLLAVEKICKDNGNCSYFPSYEIVNDDLRDYRFYASDLVHPSAGCVEYIWEKFKQSYLDETGMGLIEEGESLYKRCRHRSLVPGAPEDIIFNGKTEELRVSFAKSHPNMLEP